MLIITFYIILKKNSPKFCLNYILCQNISQSIKLSYENQYFHYWLDFIMILFSIILPSYDYLFIFNGKWFILFIIIYIMNIMNLNGIILRYIIRWDFIFLFLFYILFLFENTFKLWQIWNLCHCTRVLH